MNHPGCGPHIPSSNWGELSFKVHRSSPSAMNQSPQSPGTRSRKPPHAPLQSSTPSPCPLDLSNNDAERRRPSALPPAGPVLAHEFPCRGGAISVPNPPASPSRSLRPARFRRLHPQKVQVPAGMGKPGPLVPQASPSIRSCSLGIALTGAPRCRSTRVLLTCTWRRARCLRSDEARQGGFLPRPHSISRHSISIENYCQGESSHRTRRGVPSAQSPAPAGR